MNIKIALIVRLSILHKIVIRTRKTFVVYLFADATSIDAGIGVARHAHTKKLWREFDHDLLHVTKSRKLKENYNKLVLNFLWGSLLQPVAYLGILPI